MADFGLMVKVTEGSNDGPPIVGAKATGTLIPAITKEITTTVNGETVKTVVAMVEGFLLTVEAEGFDPYVAQEYHRPSLQAFVTVSLQRRVAPKPPDPKPEPIPIHHVPMGPATEARAREVLHRTAEEFPDLLRVFPTEYEATTAAEELLLRVIWHLHLAGFQAGRQMNPSGMISKDKFTIQLEGYPSTGPSGGWLWVDVFTLGYEGRATTLVWSEPKAEGAKHIPNVGRADGS